MSYPEVYLFTTIEDQFPKLYWPSLFSLHYDLGMNLKRPMKPVRPIAPGCLASASSKRRHKLELSAYDQNLQLYFNQEQEYKSKRSDLNIKFFNPEDHLDYHKNNLKKIFRESTDPNCESIATKGITEQKFHNLIQDKFESKIVINMGIDDFEDNPYTPDFIYWDKESNLKIDIEIDEPYDLKFGKPTHFLGIDERRNKYFSENGWLTVRFSEQQIFEKPVECCEYLENIIDLIDIVVLSDGNSDTFFTTSISEIAWTLEESINFEKAGYREKYLNIPVVHRKYVKDANSEWLIENYIETSNELRKKLKAKRLSIPYDEPPLPNAEFDDLPF